jgi:hypothetical protein
MQLFADGIYEIKIVKCEPLKVNGVRVCVPVRNSQKVMTAQRRGRIK